MTTHYRKADYVRDLSPWWWFARWEVSIGGRVARRVNDFRWHEYPSGEYIEDDREYRHALIEHRRREWAQRERERLQKKWRKR